MALRGRKHLCFNLKAFSTATSWISHEIDRKLLKVSYSSQTQPKLLATQRVNIVGQFDEYVCHRLTSASRLSNAAKLNTKVQHHLSCTCARSQYLHHVIPSSLISTNLSCANQLSCNPLLINCNSHLPSKLAPFQSANDRNMLNTTFSRLLSSTQKKSMSSGVPIDKDDKTLSSATKGIKRVKINSCGELYTELSRTRPSLFSAAPKGKGIDFEVQYYDSLEYLPIQNHKNAPVVCLLHGAPGHYEDFTSMIKYLTSKGIRVIAPNFPDYSATYEHSFRHSPKERLDYLLKFLKAINIHRLDMLVGHSSAIYTMFELLDQSFTNQTITDLQVKSLGLLSTPSYNLPSNMAVTPFRLFTLKLFDYPILRPVILALIHIIVKIQGIQNRVDRNKIENLLIAASAVGYSESERMSKQIKLVQQFKIPTYIAFGCNDRLLPMRCFEQLKRDVGIKNSNQVKLYNHNGDLTQDANSPNALVEVSQFASGGHYTFQKYSNQVNQDLYHFLKRLVLPEIDETTRL